MKLQSYIKDLTCSNCGKSFDPHRIQTFCHDCNTSLMSNYDLLSVKDHLDRDSIGHRKKGLWRWFELLPLIDQEKIVSLGEGDTPLLHLTRMGRSLCLPNLYLKEEAHNPTGSFKARGISTAISKASELGITKVVMPSAGNAGGALAAYAARAGINAMIFMPKSSPKANIIESKITGARIELVDGLINVAGQSAEEKETEDSWFNLSTFKEPYRVEGKKTMGYEIAESLGWRLPEVIIYPTGGGTGLIGMWKAFVELQTMGWLESKSMPRMISVQSEGCAPVVKAFQSGAESCEPWTGAHTIATGLCVPKSFADKLILRDIRESSGIAVSVSDKEIAHWQKQLAHFEGIFACPEGASTIAALAHLKTSGNILPDDTVIVFNTGSGLKYI